MPLPAHPALALIACLALSASTLAKEIRVDMPDPAATPLDFTLDDARPEKQRKSGPEKFSMGGCAYSSLRIGDDLFAPRKLDLLGARLQRDFGERLAGRRVTVENFVMHRNFAKQTRKEVSRQVREQVLGPLVANLPGMETRQPAGPSGCPTDDLRGAYAPEEVMHDLAPIVTVADLAVDGARFHVRTLYEPLRLEGETDADYLGRSLTAAMQQFLDAVSKALAEPQETPAAE